MVLSIECEKAAQLSVPLAGCSWFTQVLAINPQYASAYYNKAAACEKAGTTQEAIDAYRQFLSLASPRDIERIEHAKQYIAKSEE